MLGLLAVVGGGLIGVSLAAGALAGSLPDPAHDARVLLVSGVGGVLVIGLGINLLGLTRIRVASFLPALALAPILHGLAALVG